jgi:hypothetical protein
VHPTRLERRQLSLLGEDRLAVVRVDLAAPQVGVGHPLGRGEAEDALDLRADVDPAPVGRELGDIDDAVGAVDDRLEALLDLLERLGARETTAEDPRHGLRHCSERPHVVRLVTRTASEMSSSESGVRLFRGSRAGRRPSR